ncbi:MAG TPA: protease pro-enzyme activation domain-containing protein [Candidatus Eremiobacteraceae bacterium]|nr:protease pro-enzyme activation domain-containing protein [Candidatus Eremiobacteraceae bacterium]
MRIVPIVAALVAASGFVVGGFTPATARSVPLPVARRPLSSASIGIQYDADALTGARMIGRAQLGTLGVDVVVPLRDERGLLKFAQLVNDPSSPLYRHYLTPVQIGDTFGATQSDYAAAATYFAKSGLAVQRWPQRGALRVFGAQARMEAALHTTFGEFEFGSQTFYAPVSRPTVDGDVQVSGIARLVTKRKMHDPMIVVTQPIHVAGGLGNNLLLGYSPWQLASAFDYTGAYNIGITGKGITIGIIGTGPISSADVPAYRGVYAVPGTGTVKQVNVTTVCPVCSSGLQTPPPVTPPCKQTDPPNYNVCNPEDVEAQLDTEQSSALARDASVLFYLAYNPNECYTGGPCHHNPPTPALGVGEVDDELQQAIADNAADIVSLSAGGGELDIASPTNPILHPDGTGLEPDEFAMLAAEGVATFLASGDNGAEGCQLDGIPKTQDVLCVSYPASDPDVSAVGGTTTAISADGRLAGPITAWGVQTALLGSNGATGGGLSAVFDRPGYQNSATAVVGNRRGLPDIALNADLITGDAVVINAFDPNSVALGAVGGTSAAAPDAAAMWALVLQACRLNSQCGFGPSPHNYRLGNPNGIFYKLYGLPSYAQTVYDVTYGNNAVFNLVHPNQLDPGYNALAGYDLTTGIGVPFGAALVKVVTGI